MSATCRSKSCQLSLFNQALSKCRRKHAARLWRDLQPASPATRLTMARMARNGHRNASKTSYLPSARRLATGISQHTAGQKHGLLGGLRGHFPGPPRGDAADQIAEGVPDAGGDPRAKPESQKDGQQRRFRLRQRGAFRCHVRLDRRDAKSAFGNSVWSFAFRRQPSPNRLSGPSCRVLRGVAAGRREPIGALVTPRQKAQHERRAVQPTVLSCPPSSPWPTLLAPTQPVLLFRQD
jgi:hypothetical protein